MLRSSSQEHFFLDEYTFFNFRTRFAGLVYDRRRFDDCKFFLFLSTIQNAIKVRVHHKISSKAPKPADASENDAPEQSAASSATEVKASEGTVADSTNGDKAVNQAGQMDAAATTDGDNSATPKTEETQKPPVDCSGFFSFIWRWWYGDSCANPEAKTATAS